MPVTFDTMLGAHITNENMPVNLQDVGSRELGVTNWGKGVINFGLTAKKPPTKLWGDEGMSRYCARDAAYTHLILEKQVRKVKENASVYHLIKHLVIPGLEGFIQIELNGIWIDRERLLERQQILIERANALEQQLLDGLNEPFRSSVPTEGKKKWYENDNFIRKWFFGQKPDGLGLHPVSYTPTTKEPTVDKDSLGHHKDNPTVATYLQLNDINTQTKFFRQWLEYMDAHDRLHPMFNLTGTVTGRRSCAEPNLMQVPRDTFIRSIIGAPKGWVFMEFDYSQIEVRLVAWFAREEVMMDIFRKNGDIYSYTAANVMKIPYEELIVALKAGEKWAKEARQKAKAMVLGFLYGMSAGSFGEYAFNTYGVTFTEHECTEFRNEFFKTYPGLVKWHQECKLIAEKKHEIHSILGRTRHLMNIMSLGSYERWRAGAQAINSPVQGTGGDLLLMAVGTLTPIVPPDEVKLVGDIHDALLVQVREDVWEKWATYILDTMENPPGLKKFGIVPPIPLKAECKIGYYWSSGVEWHGSAEDTSKVTAFLEENKRA